MSRPTVNSPAVLEEGLLPFWTALRMEEDDLQSREAVRRVFAEQGPLLDEEEIVERLVKLGWGWDQEDLIEVVEATVGALQATALRHVRAWVHNADLAPRLAEGDAVTVTRQGQSYAGIVVSISPDRGTYTVRVPQEGHVRPGELGIQGWVFPFEQLHQQLPGGAFPPENFRLVSPLAA